MGGGGGELVSIKILKRILYKILMSEIVTCVRVSQYLRQIDARIGIPVHTSETK